MPFAPWGGSVRGERVHDRLRLGRDRLPTSGGGHRARYAPVEPPSNCASPRWPLRWARHASGGGAGPTVEIPKSHGTIHRLSRAPFLRTSLVDQEGLPWKDVSWQGCHLSRAPHKPTMTSGISPGKGSPCPRVWGASLNLAPALRALGDRPSLPTSPYLRGPAGFLDVDQTKLSYPDLVAVVQRGFIEAVLVEIGPVEAC